MDHKPNGKDQIILRQLEVIRTMTEHNLSRMGSRLLGRARVGLRPRPGQGSGGSQGAPCPFRQRRRRPAASTGNDPGPAAAPDAPPREKSRTSSGSWTPISVWRR